MESMREKPKRIDTAGPAQPLTSNPFAALGTVPQEMLARQPEADPAPEATAAAVPAFRIARTRKGDYPISVERRAAGKTVTIIRNISGDSEALLSLLKKHCATGGKAFEDSVEIQGDHTEKVKAFFKNRGL